MSSAKRALRQVIRAWITGTGPAPRIFRRCDACNQEAWRSLDRSIRKIEIDAWLADGRRADAALRDRMGRVVLVVQLASGSRLRDRSQVGAGAPMVVIDGGALAADPLRWRPMRERGLPGWRCRCAQARALPVDDGFSLRVIGCPLNLRRNEAGPQGHGGGESYASVIHDCGRCGFFVGIGYSDPERRRVSLYCSFDSSAQRRRSPLAAPPPPTAKRIENPGTPVLTIARTTIV